MLHVLVGEADVEVARWAFYGTLAVAVASVVTGTVAAVYSWKSKRNTEPNGGSSPHDKVLAELAVVSADTASVRRHVETMDERAVVEQRRAESVRGELLAGQARQEVRLERLSARQDEQAGLVDRLHQRIDTLAQHIEAAGAQADAAMDLVEKYHQTGG